MYPSSESGNIPAIPSQPYRQQETSRAAAHLRTVHPVGVFFSREVQVPYVFAVLDPILFFSTCKMQRGNQHPSQHTDKLLFGNQKGAIDRSLFG